MDSHRQRILNRMAAAQRQLGRSPWADGPFVDLQRAAADLFLEDVIRPARSAAALAVHDAGQHTTPTIGTCVACLAAYAFTPPEA